MRKLAVYEAPYMDGEWDTTALNDLWRLVAAGDREGTVVRFLALTGASSQMVEEMKQSPDWPGMCTIAHTLPYDVAICNHGSRSRVADLDRRPCLGHVWRRQRAVGPIFGGANQQEDPGSKDAGDSRPGARCIRRCNGAGVARVLPGPVIVNLGLTVLCRQLMVDA